jgi:hypothetical protein
MVLRHVLSERWVTDDNVIAPGDQFSKFIWELKEDSVIDIEDKAWRKVSEPSIEPQAVVMKATSLEVDCLWAEPSRLRVLHQSISAFELIARSPSNGLEMVVNSWITWPVSTVVSSLAQHRCEGIEAESG